MIIETTYLIKNDLQPYYRVKIENLDGTSPASSLSGASIYFTMKNMIDDTVKINRNSSNVYIIDNIKWIFEYRWYGTDTDTPGLYFVEFEINPISGGKFTIPNPIYGPARVEIKDSLDNI